MPQHQKSLPHAITTTACLLGAAFASVAAAHAPARAVEADYVGESPITFLASLTVDETGQLGRFADDALRADITGVRTSDDDLEWREPVGTGTFLGGMIYNASDSAVRVYAEVGGELREFDVAPGEGLAFGQPSLFASTHKWICICDCCENADNCSPAKWDCADDLGGACPCANYDGFECEGEGVEDSVLINCRPRLALIDDPTGP